MDNDTRAMLEGVGHTWLKARDIIAGLLRELRPDLTAAQIEHNAAAAIARLAHAGLLICTPEEMKD
jgi:hypothetical protein